MNILGVKYNNKIGIYKITNLVNNKCYIGSTSDLNRRSIHHRSYLKKGINHSVKLQNAFNKYGEENFKIEVVKLIDDISLVREFEEFYINFFDSINNGYNIQSSVRENCYISKSSKVPVLSYDLEGNFLKEYESITKCSIETGHTSAGIYEVCKENVGKCGNYIFRYKKNDNYPLKIDEYVNGNVGKIRSKESIELNRLAHLGKKQSEETKKKRSNSMVGRKMTDKQLEVGYNNISDYIKPKRSVIQIDKDSDKILNIFESIKDAAIFLNKNNGMSGICEACKGRLKTAFGFKWKYADELVSIEN